MLIETGILTELQTLFPHIKMEKSIKDEWLGNNGQLAVYPKSEEEIISILEYANSRGKEVQVMGGGTKRGFGGLTESVPILLSLTDYKGIVEHTPGDMTLTVKAGTTFKELQEYLAEHKQMISLDPAWPEYATIGGIVAANESGPKRLGYGSARDAVIGLKIAYPDGSIIRAGGKVVKNVAGYDMNKLFIGSMGTLGVITEVTVKLRPLPKYESVILLTFPTCDFHTIRSFTITLLDSMMEPAAIELLSPSLCEKLTGKKYYTLAISFEGIESSVHYQEEFVKSIQPAETEMKILQQEEAEQFWKRFYMISPHGRQPPSHNEIEASLKIGVMNLHIINVIKESERLKDIVSLAVQAHGGLGHGLCHIHLKGTEEEILLAIKEMRSAVAKLGGYVIVKYLPLAFRKKIDIWGEKPSTFFLLEGIKAKIDPNKILNPKRFVGGI